MSPPSTSTGRTSSCSHGAQRLGFNGNGGTADSKGIEFAATARPIDGLSVSLTGAYTDAELTEDTGPDLVGGFDGDPLPYVPEWTLGAQRRLRMERVRRRHGLRRRPGRLHGRADRRFRRPRRSGRAHRDPCARLEATRPRLATGMLRDHWSLELYVKNVGDEEGINDIDVAGHPPERRRRPRRDPAAHVGLALGLRF